MNQNMDLFNIFDFNLLQEDELMEENLAIKRRADDHDYTLQPFKIFKLDEDVNSTEKRKHEKDQSFLNPPKKFKANDSVSQLNHSGYSSETDNSAFGDATSAFRKIEDSKKILKAQCEDILLICSHQESEAVKFKALIVDQADAYIKLNYWMNAFNLTVKKFKQKAEEILTNQRDLEKQIGDLATMLNQFSMGRISG